MPSNLWSSLAWFALVIAVIPLALRVLKRSPIGGGAGVPGGMLRSIAALPLSTSQRIVTIEVGQGEARRWLVLGITPQSITTLHTLAPQDDLPGAPAAAAPSSFAMALAQRLGLRAAGPGHAP